MVKNWDYLVNFLFMAGYAAGDMQQLSLAMYGRSWKTMGYTLGVFGIAINSISASGSNS